MRKHSLLLVINVFIILGIITNDSLILINGDRIIGKVKDMDWGVFIAETDYVIRTGVGWEW